MINFAFRSWKNGIIIDVKNMSKKTNNDNEDFFMNSDNDHISMIAEISTEAEENDVLKVEFDKDIPVMPLRNLVMFQHVVMPVTIGR